MSKIDETITLGTGKSRAEISRTYETNWWSRIFDLNRK